MNATLDCADGSAHLKVVVVALILALLIVWIGLAAFVTNDRRSTAPITTVVAFVV